MSGYSILHFGRPDSLSSAWYAGALVIQDSLSGELVHETTYFARAHTNRFLLSRPPEDLTLQMRYRLNSSPSDQALIFAIGSANDCSIAS